MTDHTNDKQQLIGKAYERKQQRLLQKGIAMNNKAIIELSHGARQQAPYEVLKKAFHLIRRAATKTGCLDSKPCDNSACDAFNVCHHALPLRFAKERFNDHGYIYNRLLSINEEQLPSNSKIAGQLCLSVVVLNLALINHNESLININSRKQYASLANNLYNHAIGGLGNMENRGTVALIRIASLNNLTQLRYQVGNYSLAKESLHHLSIIVSAGSLDTSEEERKRPVIDAEAKKGMIMNILSLSNQHVAAAA